MTEIIRLREVIQEADKPNKNKRIYPKAILQKAVEQMQETVANRGLIGEFGLDHDELTETSIIRFAKASHLVTALFMEDDKMVADIEILNTPCGQQLQKLIQDGSAIAFRLKGIGAGDVDDNNNLVVNDSYKMISIMALPASEAA